MIAVRARTIAVSTPAVADLFDDRFGGDARTAPTQAPAMERLVDGVDTSFAHDLVLHDVGARKASPFGSTVATPHGPTGPSGPTGPEPVEVPTDPVSRLQFTPGFAVLPRQVQARMTAVVAENPRLLPDLQVLAGSSAFRRLLPETMLAGIDTIASHRPSGRGDLIDTIVDIDRQKARGTLTRLLTSDGLALIPAAQQLRLLTYVGGHSAFVGRPARVALADVMSSLPFLLGDPASRGRRLQAFIERQEGMPDAAAFNAPLRPTQERHAYDFKLRRAVQNFFDGPPGTGLRVGANVYDVSVGGHRFTLYAATPPSPVSMQRALQAIAALPPRLRDNIESVQIHPAADPQGAKMSALSGTIHIYPESAGFSQAFFESVVVHEAGHLLHDRHLGEGFQTPLGREWQEAMWSDRFFASKYGLTNMKEDFAESVALYIAVKGTRDEAELRALMPGRFRVLDALLG